MAAARKPAATKRTAAKKSTKPRGKTLPVVQGKRRTINVVATLVEFGREWRLVRPNAVVANEVIGDGEDGDVDVRQLNNYFRDHIHPDERVEFMEAAKADPTIDIPELMDLMGRMSDAVYADLKD